MKKEGELIALRQFALFLGIMRKDYSIVAYVQFRTIPELRPSLNRYRFLG